MTSTAERAYMTNNNLDIRVGELAYAKPTFILNCNYVLEVALGLTEEEREKFEEMFDMKELFSDINYNLFSGGGCQEYEWTYKSNGDLIIDNSVIIECVLNTFYDNDYVGVDCETGKADDKMKFVYSLVDSIDKVCMEVDLLSDIFDNWNGIYAGEV